METPETHLSSDLIRDFAHETVVLQPHEIMHFLNCEKCSQAWWVVRKEMERSEKAADYKEKSA